MATHNANKFNDKASTDEHNGGDHISCNRAGKEGMSKERENTKPHASNGTCIMAKGIKPTNNHQRYLVTEKQNGLTPNDGSSRSETRKDVSSKPKPQSSPRNKAGSKKVHPKNSINKKSPKKKKKKRNFRLGLGVRQRVDYGKLDKFNSRVGLTTGILQLVLALEAVTLGALQCYFLPKYAEILNVLYVWPSVLLCIMSGIFGTWSSRGKGTYVVYLYMLVSIFACITSCMVFGVEVHSSKLLRQMCSGTSSSTKSPSGHVTVPNTSTMAMEDCSNNYGLNMAISVILAIIALCQILISFVAAIGSSNVMCSKENHEILVEECLSDDDDGEPPPPNAGLPQIKRHDRAANRRS